MKESLIKTDVITCPVAEEQVLLKLLREWVVGPYYIDPYFYIVWRSEFQAYQQSYSISDSGGGSIASF